MAPTVPVEYIGHRESIRCFKQVVGKMMGKSRKVSKTYSSGIVPDYRHNVDRMAESEGFGSCGRLDTEMTASEDSYAPKRKNINLNERDKFGVPVRVLSLSKMSSSERRKLEIKLKDELEQVRILQRRVASLNSGAMVMSPASDIHNCTNGQKRPPIASIQRPAKEASVTPGKKKNPPGKNGPRTKGLHVKQNEPVTQALQETQTMPPNANSYILMNQCQTLLNRMMAHEYGWVFNEPVDVVKLNIPDYFNVIKHPMDLGTVKRKLLSGQYLDPLGFAADVRLTFANAMTYNPQGNDVHFMAKTLGKFFEIRWKVIEKKIPTFTDDLAPKSSVIVETEAATPMQPLKKAKVTPLESIVKSENKVKEEPVKRVMADIERRKLGTELESLIGDLPDNILDFLKENCSNDSSQDGEDEIELDMDALSDDTLFTLRKLLDDHLMEQKLSKPPRETEVTTNESGFSNSFVPPQKGDEPAEEEVDIGGDDLPSSSFPPVEIQKDITTHRNSKCSSSSTSSGDSGSSSSDSDSGSSSSGESDAGKDSAPVVTSKESLIPMENREQKTGVPVDDERGGTKGVLTQQNQGSSLDPAEPDYHQDDENAPPERQVSPKTLFRAAFLRSRFADTIIKAQEKTLDKGDKLDPEKLRIEREELERRRREEKARLQAEAKAAEDARRKAEEEAAAETRRKIELEREAARQALQKMEKTVDIEDNHYMEALKLFRVAPDVHLQSFREERSPDNSQEGLGSFKFQATSNPLEQLGLYMKHDEEEEEEAEPQSLPSNDPEEGEID